MGEEVRINTRADLFESRKQEYLRAGYRIENEQPTPINGLCSFVAIRVAVENATYR
jgi:hypothetical protein